MSQILFSHSFIIMELLAPHLEMCCQTVESSTGPPAAHYVCKLWTYGTQCTENTQPTVH